MNTYSQIVLVGCCGLKVDSSLEAELRALEVDLACVRERQIQIRLVFTNCVATTQIFNPRS